MASALTISQGQCCSPAMPAEGLQTSHSTALQLQLHAKRSRSGLKQTSSLRSMAV